MRIRLIPILLILLLFCSCSQSDYTEIQDLKAEVEEYHNKIILMEHETSLLKEENKLLASENVNLRVNIDHLQSDNSSLERSLEYSRNLKDDPNFLWIYTADWNNIRIKYNSGKSKHDLNSANLMPFIIIGSIRNGWEPEAMDEGICSYEFTYKDLSYEIEIFQEHTFKYQNDFYYCEENLFTLYESFIPYSLDWLKTNNVLNLIYNSSIVNINNYYIVTDRTKGLAMSIESFQKVAPPTKKNVGNVQDVIKCYNHGEVITISIYDNFFSMQHKNVTTWYKGTEDRPASGIMSIFTAG